MKRRCVPSATTSFRKHGCNLRYFSATGAKRNGNNNENNASSSSATASSGKNSNAAPASSSDSFVENRIPPSWRHGDLGAPKQTNKIESHQEHLLRQREFQNILSDHDEDVDGPITGFRKFGDKSAPIESIDLKTGKRKDVLNGNSNNPSNAADAPEASSPRRRPPPNSSRSDINKDGEEEEELKAFKTSTYHSESTPGDEEYYRTANTIANSIRERIPMGGGGGGGGGASSSAASGGDGGRSSTSSSYRSGIGSGAHTNRVGHAKSKFQQYGQRGYDWVEMLAKKGHYSNDHDLKVNMVLICLAIAAVLYFIYWMAFYRTVLLTTDVHRREVTRLPSLPADFVYMQSKWPWSLVSHMPWSTPDKTLLMVVEEEAHERKPSGQINPNFPSAAATLTVAGATETAATGNDVSTTAAAADEASASVKPTTPATQPNVAINSLYVSSHLYRGHKDYVIQVHLDPVTGRHSELRHTYNKIFYRAIPYLAERDLPFLVNLGELTDPLQFQKELNATTAQLKENVMASPDGLPDNYPTTKRGNSAKFGGGAGNSNNSGGAFAPKLLLKFRLRLKRDFPSPSNIGSGEFVQAVFDECVKAVFSKYYYNAIIRHHELKKGGGGNADQKLMKKMLETGVINGYGVTFEEIFDGDKGERFVDDVLNEIILRVRENAIIINKSGSLV